MNVVTKIFAVIATVLSLVVATLASVYSLNAGAIRADYENVQARQDANEASLKAQASERAERIASLELDREQARAEATELRARIQRLETDLVTVESAKRQAEADAAQVARQIGQLAQTVDTQQALIASYRTEVQELRAGELAFRKREIDLVDRLNDLESQNGVLDQTVRALEVELADAQRQLAQGGGPGIARTSGPVDIPGDPIAGEVTEVREQSGRQIVQIDLGSRDRMVDRARLFVVRNGDFLGYLTLNEVDLDSAVGVIDTLNANVTVQTGDTVVTSFSSGRGG